MASRPDSHGTLQRRVAALVARFEEIAHTRMAGVPVVNPALRVEAVGFVAQTDEPVDDGASVAAGILVTPWFMNLVRLPLQPDVGAAGVGAVQRHPFGGRTFEFIGAHEESLGAYAACSLFSPMFEFAGPDAARATALAVLAELRRDDGATAPQPARRSFLFGRGAAHEAAR